MNYIRAYLSQRLSDDESVDPKESCRTYGTRQFQDVKVHPVLLKEKIPLYFFAQNQNVQIEILPFFQFP